MTIYNGHIVDATFDVQDRDGSILADGEVGFHPENESYVGLPDLGNLPPGDYLINVRIEVAFPEGVKES